VESFANYKIASKAISKITFYADKDDIRNKLFSFQVSTYLAAFNILNKFVKNGHYIRSAFTKGMLKDLSSAVPYQERVSKEYIELLNSGFNPDFVKFFCTLT
jgi:hypothetical protein